MPANPAIYEPPSPPTYTRETQRDKVLRMLKAGPVCSTQFLERYIPRAAARIWELRAEGYWVETRKCRQHKHDTPQVEYELS